MATPTPPHTPPTGQIVAGNINIDITLALETDATCVTENPARVPSPSQPPPTPLPRSPPTPPR